MPSIVETDRIIAGRSLKKRRELGRIDEIAAYGQNFVEPQHAVRIRDAKYDVAYLVYGLQISRWLKQYRTAIGDNFPAGLDNVLLGQRAEYLLRRDAELRELGRRNLEIYALILNAENFNLPDTLERIKQIACVARDLAHFREREAVRPQRRS